MASSVRAKGSGEFVGRSVGLDKEKPRKEVHTTIGRAGHVARRCG